jgi:hypothetical protein
VRSTTANADAPFPGGKIMEQPETHLSRRNVLFVAGGAALAAGAVFAAPVRELIVSASQSLINGAPPRTMVNLATASYEQWLAQVNTSFAVSGGNPLKLLGVEPLNSTGQRPGGLRARAFALAFNVSGGGTMAGDLIYTINHPQYGALRIFLTSADPGTPTRMLAVFN